MTAKRWEQLGVDDYAGYLQSDRWKQIRARVLKRDEQRCRRCSNKATQVHHRSYHLDVFLGIGIKQLVSLCRTCHREIEFDERGVKLSLVETEERLQRGLRPAPGAKKKRKKRRRGKNEPKSARQRKGVSSKYPNGRGRKLSCSKCKCASYIGACQLMDYPLCPTCGTPYKERQVQHHKVLIPS